MLKPVNMLNMPIILEDMPHELTNLNKILNPPNLIVTLHAQQQDHEIILQLLITQINPSKHLNSLLNIRTTLNQPPQMNLLLDDV